MPSSVRTKQEPIVVSALTARANLGKLLGSVADEQRLVLIKKRGVPQAVLLSLGKYIKLTTPEPEILRIIGEESVRNGTDKLTSRQIDQIIRDARAERKRKK
jgi:prevent-host-death family protein